MYAKICGSVGTPNIAGSNLNYILVGATYVGGVKESCKLKYYKTSMTVFIKSDAQLIRCSFTESLASVIVAM